MKKQMPSTVTTPLTSADLAAIDGGMPSGRGPSQHVSRLDKAAGYAGHAQNFMSTAQMAYQTGRMAVDVGRSANKYLEKKTGLTFKEAGKALLDPYGPRR
jgi:hypothetical protein